ncbi:MAG: hypothetical protein V3S82_10250 [Dehalococcoidia bacterium]
MNTATPATITEITNDFVTVTTEDGKAYNLNHYNLPGHLIDNGVGTPVTLIQEPVAPGSYGITTWAESANFTLAMDHAAMVKAINAAPGYTAEECRAIENGADFDDDGNVVEAQLERVVEDGVCYLRPKVSA